MKNLTQNQELIIDQLVTEFTNINKTFNAHGDNIFKPLLVDVAKGEKCIAEINALHKAGEEAIKDQMSRDFDKFHWMFEELGLTLESLKVTAGLLYWRLRASNNSITDNLQWTYYRITKEADYILGRRHYYTSGHFIKYSYKKFNTIEELFEDEGFKSNLKNFISKN